MLIKVLILSLMVFFFFWFRVNWCQILWLQIFAKLVWFFFQKYLCFAWIRREDLWWGIYMEYASYLWGQNTYLLWGAMNNLKRIKDWSSTHALKHKSSMRSYAHSRSTFHLFVRFPWFFCTMWPHICHALHFSKYEVPHTSSIWLVKKTSCGNHITIKK